MHLNESMVYYTNIAEGLDFHRRIRLFNDGDTHRTEPSRLIP